MDEDEARARVRAERAEVQRLLKDTEAEGRQDRVAEDERGVDVSDPAQPLTAEGENDAIVAQPARSPGRTRPRRAAAGQRDIRRSIRSGLPIPDERLEADPAAELTIEEARARR